MSRTAQKKNGVLIFLGTFKGQSLVQAPLVLSPEESACPPAHQPLDHDPDHGGGWLMTVSPRVTHNLVTPQLAALTCMCDFHLNQAQYRFCVCLQSIHDSSDRSQSLFYVLLSLLRQALCMHSDWYQTTTRSRILDIITNNVVTLLWNLDIRHERHGDAYLDGKRINHLWKCHDDPWSHFLQLVSGTILRLHTNFQTKFPGSNLVLQVPRWSHSVSPGRRNQTP